MNKRGKFYAIYGVNNLGKTLQAKKLLRYLNKKGRRTKYIKHPVYSNRSGSLINDYLRKKNPAKITKEDFDILQIINKYEASNELERTLSQGIDVVAEDYVLTGIAWAMAQTKKPLRWFEYFYNKLLLPDSAVLLSGKRFLVSREKNHKYEINAPLTKRAKLWHIRLAKKNNIAIIDANQTPNQVHREIIKNLFPKNSKKNSDFN